MIRPLIHQPSPGNGPTSSVQRTSRVRHTVVIAALLLGSSVLTPVRAEDTFKLAVIGDMQRVTDLVTSPTADHYPIFTNITDWIGTNAQAENIRFVSQIGDIVEHGDDTDEYDLALGAMNTLSTATNADGGTGIPWAVSYGNHEKEGGNTGDPQAFFNNTNYRDYFSVNSGSGTHRNEGDIGFGAYSSNHLNSWHTFKSSSAVGAREYLMLNLEYDVPGGSITTTAGTPSFDAVAWAQGVIDAHPGMPTIVQTHVFEGDRSGPPKNPYNTEGPGRNSQLQIFENLIAGNSQIFMVLNGHSKDDTHRFRLNDANKPVLQMITDFTNEIEDGITGGNPLAGGYFRQVEFDEDNGQIRVSTYSPSTDDYLTDGNGQFTWDVNWATRFDGAAPAMPSNSLVAYFKLDEGETNSLAMVAYDSASAPQHGILTGAVVYNPNTNSFRNDSVFDDDEWRPGISGGALDFGHTYTNTSNPGDQNDDVVEVPNSGVGTKYDLTGAITLSAWVNLDDNYLNGVNSTRHIAGKDMVGGPTDDSFGLNHNMAGDADQLRFMIGSGGVNTTLIAPTPFSEYKDPETNDGWVHIVGVFSPDNYMRLYVDGVLEAEFTEAVDGVPSAIDSTDTPFTIGRLAGAYRHALHGTIDDVQLYSEALELSQILELFQNPGFSLFSGTVGDYNQDGIVNLADYTVWRNNLGSNVELPNRDPANTGAIGAADYDSWKAHFGEGSSALGASQSAQQSNVPEPATAVLLMLAGLVAAGSMRARS
ncbi:LamG-like jellyroll fold domain-containing protein [Aeoliella sp.]|uniref:LamG-like jellyroll fold domain-containing protein n=1 Tax=Aeoliella sp. TaxID=2795800 RepID=UPI003CCBB027